MVFVPRDLTYNGLMNTIEDIVRIDSSSYDIELRAVMTTSGRRAIPRIKNDRDVAFLMSEDREVLDGEHHPTIPLSSKKTMSAINDPPPTINDASEDVGTNNEVGATASAFETFVDNGLDGLHKQYPFQQDGDGDYNGDCGFDLDGDGDSDSDSGSDIDGEGDSGCDLDDGDGSSLIPRPWIIHGADKYSIQTINNDEPSSTNGRFYKAAESFQQIPSYLYKLERENPGTVTSFSLNGRNQFKYCFFAYSACLHRFDAVIRHVVAIDGAYLKGRLRGILFVAVCKDANEQMYPLAFGIGQKESRKSWS
ncbi:hypothetical protein Dsin_018961 [Dipteronia sinensis]|uniref:MULE transposase domain-containing protein n=1 Tax=Dipteronia sinensis TaxID=43782 RepID=A0AAE0A6A9_9ROSI|nr:hypothetical protein Dsin_018961 [Dipteronia sinensis]